MAIQSACHKVFMRQQERAKAKVKQLLKSRKRSLLKGEDDDLADEINKALEEEWKNLPAQVRDPLETAVYSGLQAGFIQLQIQDTKLIRSANTIAADYARERAAELVGMSFDEEGNLVENPDAEWAISDTTREKIKEIVAEGFEGETDVKIIADRISTALEEDDAGIFSLDRARTIANTEVAHAQAGANFRVWQESGMVETVKWTVSADEPCEDCADNEDEVRDLGDAFPTGDIMPPVHPNCRCVLVAVKITEPVEGGD